MPIEFVYTERRHDITGMTGVDTLLNQDPFPYDFVMVNALAPDARDVVEIARIAIELISRPDNRIIYLHVTEPSADLIESGVTCIPARGGNGYLLPQDAAVVAEMIRRLCE